MNHMGNANRNSTIHTQKERNPNITLKKTSHKGKEQEKKKRTEEKLQKQQNGYITYQ